MLERECDVQFSKVEFEILQSTSFLHRLESLSILSRQQLHMSQLCFQATPLAPSLTFVNATGGKLDKKAKNAVRGHVTRRVFQERRYRKLGQNAEDLAAEKQDKLAASTSTTSIPSTPKFVNLDITHVAPKRRCMRRKTEVLVEAADHRFPLLRKMGLKPDLLNKSMSLL